MRRFTWILTLVLLGAGQVAYAFTLKVKCTVVESFSQAPMDGARVRIYKNGVRQRALATDGSGTCAVTLDNQAAYVLRFDAPGFQTKCFTVDTRGPEWQGESGLTVLDVEVILNKSLQGVDLSFFDLPLGIAHFEPSTGWLAWDKTYDQHIRKEALSVMERYVHRCDALGLEVRGTGGDLGTSLHSWVQEALARRP